MNLNLKRYLSIGTAAFSLLPFLGSAGEVADRSMVWAHNTPWFRPEDYPVYTQGFYNFPLQPAPETGHKMEDSLAEEVKITVLTDFSLISAAIRAKVRRTGAIFSPAT